MRSFYHLALGFRGLRLGTTAMILFGSACNSSASYSEPKTSNGVPGPSPDEEALLCGGNTSTRSDVVKFEKGMPRPKAVHIVPPTLTGEAKRSGVEGTLVFNCVITKDGSVTDCCILRGINGLNRPFFDAVRTWRYEPVVLNGEPINVAYVIQVKVIGNGPQLVVPFPPPH
jgi:TonB family protein